MPGADETLGRAQRDVHSGRFDLSTLCRGEPDAAESAAAFSPRHMKEVTIICDGSSLGNGGRETRGAAAALLDHAGRRRLVGAYLGAVTNQQAEIVAACLGLEALREGCRVRLLTDSQYVVKTMTGLFKRKANLELWARLDRAALPHRVNWEWTRGHAGHKLQEKCDRAARLIAARGAVEPDALEAILSE